MQSKLDTLTARVSEAEERINDIKDKLMERREAEEKREKQLMDHEGRFQEISDATKGNNIRITGVPNGEERGPEGKFEQIIAENFPNLGKEIGIHIKWQRGPLPK